MKTLPRLVSLLVVSFAAASAFAVDAPTSINHPVRNDGATLQAAPKSGSTVEAFVVKCTNPRECSVGGA